MANRIFTKNQQEEILKNPNVLSCSDRYIAFTDDFKKKVISRYKKEGIPASLIFKEAGFDIKVIGLDAPKNSLSRWVKQSARGALSQKKGRKKSALNTVHMTDKEQIAHLKAEVDYLRSLHSFLAKRQAEK